MEAGDAITSLMRTVLPGGAGFPSAHDTGMAPLLIERLRRADPDHPQDILAALAAQGTIPESPDAWTEAARRLEALHPKLFAEFLKYAYLTYYEQPAVIAAIRTLGFRYNDHPLPEGYPDEPFDPDRDAPRHVRGRWLQTHEIERVDLGGLDLESLR